MGDKIEFCKGIGLGMAAGLAALFVALLVWTLVNPDNVAIRVARHYFG